MKDNNKHLKIGIVAPFPPPFGGMTVLAETLKRSLLLHKQTAVCINTNPTIFGKNKKSKLAKILQLLIYFISLRKAISCQVIIVMSSSGNYFFTKALPALILGKLFKKPVILDFVGGEIIEKIDKGNTRILRWIKKFELTIVPTHVFCSAFSKVGIDTIVFPHIVDIERFSHKKKNINVPVFLAAKGLAEYSNVASIIRAFSVIKKNEPHAKLLIAGNGPEKGNLEILIKELGVSDIEFMGNISYFEMPEIFNNATIFLHGTRIESFGIALVEAMASGTPIISTNVGGIPEIIQHGYNGILVNYDDYNGIASQAIDLLRNSVKYNQIARNGIQSSLEYSIDTLTPKLIDLVRSTISL